MKHNAEYYRAVKYGKKFTDAKLFKVIAAGPDTVRSVLMIAWLEGRSHELRTVKKSKP